jgi:hypothetical protein
MLTFDHLSQDETLAMTTAIKIEVDRLNHLVPDEKYSYHKRLVSKGEIYQMPASRAGCLALETASKLAEDESRYYFTEVTIYCPDCGAEVRYDRTLVKVCTNCGLVVAGDFYDAPNSQFSAKQLPYYAIRDHHIRIRITKETHDEGTYSNPHAMEYSSSYPERLYIDPTYESMAREAQFRVERAKERRQKMLNNILKLPWWQIGVFYYMSEHNPKADQTILDYMAVEKDGETWIVRVKDYIPGADIVEVICTR